MKSLKKKPPVLKRKTDTPPIKITEVKDTEAVELKLTPEPVKTTKRSK